MTINELQATVDRWIKEHGVRYFDELTNTAVLMEEVGEIARIMSRRYGEQSEKESDKNKDLGDELSDVLFVLTCIRSEEHTSELQSRPHLVCRLLLEKKKKTDTSNQLTI